MRFSVALFFLALGLTPIAQGQITVTIQGSLVRVPANAYSGFSVGDPVSLSFSTGLSPTIPITTDNTVLANTLSDMTAFLGATSPILAASDSGDLKVVNSGGGEALFFDFSGSLSSFNAVAETGHDLVSLDLRFITWEEVGDGFLVAPAVSTLAAFDGNNWDIQGGTVAFLGTDGSSPDYFSMDFIINDIEVDGAIGAVPEPSSLALLLGLAGIGVVGMRRRRQA